MQDETTAFDLHTDCKNLWLWVIMRGSRKFFQSGPTLFSYWVDPNGTKIGPSSADGPTLNAGLVALWFFRGSWPVLLINPIFCDFSGGGGSGSPVRPPPLWHRTLWCQDITHIYDTFSMWQHMLGIIQCIHMYKSLYFPVSTSNNHRIYPWCEIIKHVLAKAYFKDLFKILQLYYKTLLSRSTKSL